MIALYCYDAYCGWCYGFSPVIQKIAEDFKNKMDFEVLSGGMIPPDDPKPISVLAPVIKENYKRVEELSGIQFGPDFLWHVFNPDKSDWYPHSEKAAIAMCIFKELFPDKQIAFATDLQYALNFEGRDLTDDEAYRHLLDKYQIEQQSFYKKLKEDEYRDMARHEYSLCRQLQVTGFPALLLQSSPTKFYLVARGYTSYQNVRTRMDNILKEIE
jgi:putative protein-disulfide isomerase